MRDTKSRFSRDILASIRNALAVVLAYSMAEVSDVKAEEPGVIKNVPPIGMTRADIAFLKTDEAPCAILVLCPGYNGDGARMIEQKVWRDFAREKHLGLAGLQFESPVALLDECQGYYQASKGSGDILMQSLRKAFGRDLPILIYGFSGGAHFTTRFVQWSPDRIKGWCALGAGVLDQPTTRSSKPLGLMACGEDDPRLGGALIYFKQGRAAGGPWLWVEIPKTGHAMTPELDDFVRHYFAVLLKPEQSPGLWVDIDSKNEASAEEAQSTPSLTGWLPDRGLLASWHAFGAQ